MYFIIKGLSIMKISKRIEKMNFSSIRKLTPLADEARRKGIKIYPLNIGQPDIVTPDTFFQGVNNYKEKIVKYSNSEGITELRETFSKNFRKWNMDILPDEILITAGGSEAVIFTILSICDPGDEVIIPEPYYSNYDSFVKMADSSIVPVHTSIEDGFHLPSKEEIVSKITSKTKAILFSNPSNPTGTVYTEAEIKMLGEIAEEYDLYIISDEVYREFTFENTSFISPIKFENLRKRTIIIDSISKHYSACGARIGLVATKNEDLKMQMLKLCQARLCASTIEQYAASNLINTLESYIEKVKAIYKSRRDVMYEGLCNIEGVTCFKPEGSFYIFVKLPIDDGEKFSRWLLTDFNHDGETVMVAPGKGFYQSEGRGINEIRLSYCIDEKEIKRAIEILNIAIKEYNKLNVKY